MARKTLVYPVDGRQNRGGAASFTRGRGPRNKTGRLGDAGGETMTVEVQQRLGHELALASAQIARWSRAVEHIAAAIGEAVADLARDEGEDDVRYRHDVVTAHVTRASVLLLEIQGESSRMAGAATARGFLGHET